MVERGFERGVDAYGRIPDDKLTTKTLTTKWKQFIAPIENNQRVGPFEDMNK